MRIKTVITWILVILLAALLWPKTEEAEAEAPILEFVWDWAQFNDGARVDVELTPDGLSMAAQALTALYTSPPIETPGNFNAIVPEWSVDQPDRTSFEILFRTSQNGSAWSEWYDIHTNADWDEADDALSSGDMIVVPAADKTHRFIQFHISFSRYLDTPAPTLNLLKFVLIDTSGGPTTAELIARQQAINTAAGDQSQLNGYARPFVIERSTWCLESECWYSDDIEYETVTHLLMHHTVTSSSGDTAATVRAIWQYHAFTRGWGDIGYNYLIDLDGLIFEGHLNGNYEEWDVVGTHAADANRGGFGTSLIGNFTSPEEGSGIQPSTAMLNAMADLFAWKADQRDIDPYGASQMVEMNWGLQHVMGHRDVYGGLNTLCPGGNAHNYLPWLRDAIASRIGYVSPYIFVDEISNDFSKSNANWYEGPRGCGQNNHSYYTWSTTDPGESTNWGEWELNVPASGRYRIEIYAPYCNTGEPETLGARYTVNHAFGSDTVTVNQDANVGLWMTVGEFDLQTNSDNSLYLSDLTNTDNGRGVWFDAVRLLYLGESIASIDNAIPLAGAWHNTPAIDFSWQIMSTAPIIETTLQAAPDSNMNNLVLNQTWQDAVLQHTHTFTEDYAELYWRVTAVVQQADGSTASVTSSPTMFSLDITPPASAVDTIYHVPDRSGFGIGWQGADELSGLAWYTVEYRTAGSGSWQALVSNTTESSAWFDPPDGQTYEFRSQATDIMGNVEATHSTADVNTNQSILLSHAIMLPAVQH